MSAKVPTPNVHRALQSLGENLRVARLKRRMPVRGFAERIGVSERTVIRLEKGDGGVGIGTLAMACLVLGELERVAEFLEPGSDETGLLLDNERLPRRIDSRRRTTSTSTDMERTGDGDVEGVGF